jgi:uncharacterized damage-inducible protein DinB
MNTIHRKPTYRIYIEAGAEGAMAHVAELPGCFAVGSDAARAAGAVGREITAFLQWLRGHRERLVPEAHISRPSMADLYVAEVREGGAPLVGGSRAALFPYDEERWTDEKLERTLRWLTYSRADLLAAVEDMSDEEVEARQVRSGVSLGKVLRHVANAEYGYINRVVGPLGGVERITDEEPSGVRERLEAVREVLVRRAREVPPDERGKVIYPTWAERPDEPWTLAKTLRRALEHEREHLAEIRK